MNLYRSAGLATAAALVAITLTACQGGITTPSSATSPAANSSSGGSPSTASSPPSTPASTPPASNSSAPNSSSGGSTVSVGGSVGSFPLPPGAQVVSNVTSGSDIDIVLAGVSPSAAESFYASALPGAGYTITSNASGSVAGTGATGINFTGHGYKGEIGAVSDLGLGALGGAGTIGIHLSPA